jgi:excisionase family DNA binding protein
MPDKYLDIGKASAYLNIAKSTLYAYISRNKVPHIKLGDRVLFDAKDLDSWIAGMKKNVKGTAQGGAK